jgi:hypothetical protein
MSKRLFEVKSTVKMFVLAESSLEAMNEGIDALPSEIGCNTPLVEYIARELSEADAGTLLSSELVYVPYGGDPNDARNVGQVLRGVKQL